MVSSPSRNQSGGFTLLEVVVALAERGCGGTGRRIDVSMAQVALSWLQTFLPMLDMDSPPEELRRALGLAARGAGHGSATRA